MSKTSQKRTRSGYRTVGTTSDGIKVLKPKTKPKSFTTAEIRETIRQVLERRAEAEAEAETKSSIATGR